ncbi:MAG: DUF1566 domain-containing protein [Bacteroidetes bacterium]|nr:DUF1566 domain-containing protein [Bacteroidota bacterium]
MIKMKKITLLSTFCFLLLTLVVKAQTPPNAFNYSAVARNASGQPIAKTTIGIQISILKNSPTGASKYSENHFVNTDGFGLFNLVIGAGAVQSGSMANIGWSNDNYYLKVGMDATGGTNFLTMGTTQLLSVPYALHAKTADSIVGGGSGGGGFTHYIGEEFGGGVIFHLWKDNSVVEHGLIVDKTDLSMNKIWSNVDNIEIDSAAQSSWDGFSNSLAIVNQAGHTNSAAALCLNSTNGGQSDWYLPSIDELSLLFHNRFNINKAFSTINGASELPNTKEYWSSTEENSISNFAGEFAWRFWFSASQAINDVSITSKSNMCAVRAIRFF